MNNVKYSYPLHKCNISNWLYTYSLVLLLIFTVTQHS